MKIFMTGATGFIGRSLTVSLLAAGHDVVAISRGAKRAKEILGEKVRIVEGNPAIAGDWLEEVKTSAAVINLCGAPIMKKKWTPSRKQHLLDSRILPTRLIVEAIKSAADRPKVLISGSAIGYYGDRGDEIVDETSPPGNDFGAKLCSQWEAEAEKASELGVRVVTLRTGMVLGRGGGSLAQMIIPFKFFAGGRIGSGRQYISWIHLKDHVGITMLALADNSLTGPINMTTPSPAQNRDFMAAIGKAMGRPSWLPIPSFALKIIFGEGADLPLGGQRVLPEKAQEAGYIFLFSDLSAALADVLA